MFGSVAFVGINATVGPDSKRPIDVKLADRLSLQMQSFYRMISRRQAGGRERGWKILDNSRKYLIKIALIPQGSLVIVLWLAGWIHVKLKI